MPLEIYILVDKNDGSTFKKQNPIHLYNMFAIFNQNENPVSVTIGLLRQLKVRVTEYTVRETILNHPDYPSMLSISDALKSWNIENAALKIDTDKLQELPLPFIAYTKAFVNAFVLITEINNGTVLYFDGDSKIKSKPLEDFIEEFKGVVLLAKATVNSGEKDLRAAKKIQWLQRIKIPVFMLAGLLAIVFSILSFTTILWSGELPIAVFTGYVILMILKFCGLLVTCLLLWYETDKANPVLQKICSGGGKTNCNAILNSGAAKIFGLSWSEIGFFYFAGGYLWMLSSNSYQIATDLQLIQLLNLIALPYIFFSVFYQWRIAKQWCPMCLTVQAILILEFATNILLAPSVLHHPLSVSISQLPAIFISFTMPIIIWFIVKPLLYRQQQAKQEFRSLQRIKFNSDIFNALLEKQKHVESPTDGLGIVLGNKNATNTLIKVCNPYCGPCAKAHPEIEKLLEENNNLKVQIIFFPLYGNNHDRTMILKHIMSITERENEITIQQALNDWYLAEKKDYEVFARKYSMDGELKKQDAKIIKMKEWCDETGISFTPTIFINGYQLPSVYNISDIKYFLLE